MQKDKAKISRIAASMNLAMAKNKQIMGIRLSFSEANDFRNKKPGVKPGHEA